MRLTTMRSSGWMPGSMDPVGTKNACITNALKSAEASRATTTMMSSSRPNRAAAPATDPDDAGFADRDPDGFGVAEPGADAG
jgi:hypothetical protein